MHEIPGKQLAVHITVGYKYFTVDKYEVLRSKVLQSLKITCLDNLSPTLYETTTIVQQRHCHPDVF